uniref:Bromo domain-containing protein n=1 Tax=Bionectria ochroleuca TaxID=29856 RepID=A0A0B7JHJ0_BIOOC
MSDQENEKPGHVEPPSQNGHVNTPPPFSWLQPHPIFVIILVGSDELPFGIQKDFLCSRSVFFRDYFEKQSEDTVEHIVKLPEATSEIFGLIQHYLYTGQVIADVSKTPSYESLVGLWKLAHKLQVDGLCEKTLDAMIECRRITGRIPSTPLLIQVWKDTPEGSSIRTLLLSWAAEYMRSSDARAEFAKSLPQEVLSELVVTMSSFDTQPSGQTSPDQTSTASFPSGLNSALRKNVHYLDDKADEESTPHPKKGRLGSGSGLVPLPLEFCADLLTRMLSGPGESRFSCCRLLFQPLRGFWTRLVGPFKDPVVPEQDGVPDYLEKVKRPMDLGTIKAKMDRHEYKDEAEFLVDMRQIFDNCFIYWKTGDPMWAAGQKLQKTFEEKYSGMNKWIAKLGGDDP